VEIFGGQHENPAFCRREDVAISSLLLFFLARLFFANELQTLMIIQKSVHRVYISILTIRRSRFILNDQVSAKERLMDALLLAEPGLLNYGLVPSMLMELACLYERFGAFEGALELMGKVTEFFPDFGKYGEVLHRAAVVMAHLSTLPNAPIPELMDRYEEFAWVARVDVYASTV